MVPHYWLPAAVIYRGVKCQSVSQHQAGRSLQRKVAETTIQALSELPVQSIPLLFDSIPTAHAVYLDVEVPLMAP